MSRKSRAESNSTCLALHHDLAISIFANFVFNWILAS